MKKTFIFLLTGLLGTLSLYAQNQNKFSIGIFTEVPGWNLSSSNFTSMQTGVAFGYRITDDFSLYVNESIGLMGENPEGSGYIRQVFNTGIAADYLFLQFKNNSKLGVEVSAGVSTNFIDDKNSEHYWYQGGIKWQVYFTSLQLGIRNKAFEHRTNTELFLSIGFTLH
jgi:hypothetical protein